MAKSSVPMPSGGSTLPKLISGLIGLAVLVMVVKHPTESASGTTNVVNGIGNVVDGLATFLHALG